MNLALHRLIVSLIAVGGAMRVMAEPPSSDPNAFPLPTQSAGSAATDVLGAVPGAGPASSAKMAKGRAAAPPATRAADGLAPGETAVVPSATQPPQRATPLSDIPAGLGFEGTDPDAAAGERAVFKREAIRVVLALNRERLVTFPGSVAFHAPEGFETLVQSQIIDRTAYLKAVAPFGTLRVVAEDIHTGRKIPIDLVLDAKTTAALRPVDVLVAGQASAGSEVSADELPTSTNAARTVARSEVPALDMVSLTRYASQTLYAPRRLVPAIPGVRQLPVNPVPVEGLYRGWRVETTPIGAWRSGGLYVTAVRFTNQGQHPIDIDLQEMRGRWLAATAQHTRLLAAGSDWGSTTVYLVCDRPFDACR